MQLGESSSDLTRTGLNNARPAGDTPVSKTSLICYLTDSYSTLHKRRQHLKERARIDVQIANEISFLRPETVDMPPPAVVDYP